MARFLEDIKPCIRRDQLLSRWNMKQFFANRIGICCASLYCTPWFSKRLGQAVHLAPLPLEPGGYVGEGSFLGAVPQASESMEEATLLLGFIASEKGQAALVEEHPEWLSVNQAVLARQKATSPYPKGSVIYEYDTHNGLMRKDLHQMFSLHHPRMETEAAKFYIRPAGIWMKRWIRWS